MIATHVQWTGKASNYCRDTFYQILYEIKEKLLDL